MWLKPKTFFSHMWQTVRMPCVTSSRVPSFFRGRTVHSFEEMRISMLLDSNSSPGVPEPHARKHNVCLDRSQDREVWQTCLQSLETIHFLQRQSPNSHQFTPIKGCMVLEGIQPLRQKKHKRRTILLCCAQTPAAFPLCEFKNAPPPSQQAILTS